MALSVAVFLTVLIALAGATQAAATSSGAAEECSAFTTDAGSIFTHQRFYDFRNLSTITVRSGEGSVSANSSKSVGDYWTQDWHVTDLFKWEAHDGWAPILYSPETIARSLARPCTIRSIFTAGDAHTFIEQDGDGTVLEFTTTQLQNGTQKSAEMRFREYNVTSLSLRVRARVTGSPGACSGFFTYYNDTQETDIEVLTRDPVDLFHGSCQPTHDARGRSIPETSLNISMTDDGAGTSREEWNTYRLDWLPGQSLFYLNGIQLAQTKKNVPVSESQLIISMFGNGGSWSGPMDVGNTATLEVQWINFAFNSTAASPASGGATCNIDDPDFLSELPPPEIAQDSSQPHTAVLYPKLTLLLVFFCGMIVLA
ncbi:hypothetical protein jhhlp_008817 [Lomentospora prolificans]|uniref:GH16 domain-containing protein n=1 Tax=Lomentospora prolificans TaxID=41688 RepID=A0A2N3MZ35_9PEZI|nr:hypothetical protein jhhlp_008817 [Lomentospora prolificans]